MGRSVSPMRDYWRGRHVVYRCFDWEGSLLYIGASSDLYKRWRVHVNRTPWFREVEKIAIKIYPNRWVAFAEENKAIQAERPRYNVRNAA